MRPNNQRLIKLYMCLLLAILITLIAFIARSSLHSSHFTFYTSEDTRIEALLNRSQVKTHDQTITCTNDDAGRFRIEQRGEFLILVNYVRATRRFRCDDETITYTTQADYSFLDNVPVLVERWRGPISVALYAPGDDFRATLEAIAHLRNCAGKLIKELVTFHVFFSTFHYPTMKYPIPIVDYYDDLCDCTKPAPYKNVNPNSLYKRRHNLTYPINVARNIARQAATTHYVFASDIELYPTPHLIDKFFGMLAEQPEMIHRKNRHVFALPIYELVTDAPMPLNKSSLQKLLHEKKAFLFHQRLCPDCHAVPRFKEWQDMWETPGLHVFTVGKRLKLNKLWEAFYIGTKDDPLFDERLTWEGQSNKMTQAYSMCLLNYDYLVLDNAFIVHKPGIKHVKEQVSRFQHLVTLTNNFIKHTVRPQLNALYGYRDGCFL